MALNTKGSAAGFEPNTPYVPEHVHKWWKHSLTPGCGFVLDHGREMYI